MNNCEKYFMVIFVNVKNISANFPKQMNVNNITKLVLKQSS